MSLVVPYQLASMRSRPAPHLQPGTLVRFSVGLEGISRRFSVTNTNRIKPGIAESTRAVMRRVPEHVLVRSRDDQDVQLLLHLSAQAHIDVQEVGDALGPYRALTVIRSVR